MTTAQAKTKKSARVEEPTGTVAHLGQAPKSSSKAVLSSRPVDLETRQAFSGEITDQMVKLAVEYNQMLWLAGHKYDRREIAAFCNISRHHLDRLCNTPYAEIPALVAGNPKAALTINLAAMLPDALRCSTDRRSLQRARQVVLAVTDSIAGPT